MDKSLLYNSALLWAEKDKPFEALQLLNEIGGGSGELDPYMVSNFQANLLGHKQIRTADTIKVGIDFLESCVRERPEVAQYWSNLSYMYLMGMEPSLALDMADKALEVDPELTDARIKRYNALFAIGRYVEQLEEQKRVYHRTSDRMDRAGIGLTSLLLNEYRDGDIDKLSLVDYGGRSEVSKKFTNNVGWIRLEQGIGDCLMMSRYMRNYISDFIGAKKWDFGIYHDGRHDEVVSYLPPLVYVPHISFVDIRSYGSWPYNWMFDLLGYAQFDKYEAKEYADNGKILLCFQGNPHHPNDWFRSIRYEKVRPYIRKGMIVLGHSLPDAVKEDIKSNGAEVYDQFGLKQLEEVILSVGRVVTVDTATCHLAGLLGKRCDVMLSTMVDWRWGHSRKDNHWYESVNIHRQEKLGAWDEMLGKLLT